MKNKKRAFTLTELLVVVIVLGTLAAVAVPKFSRVLETRRTGEAEEMLSAVRTEQEKRCTLGQNYTGDFSKMTTVAYAKSSDSQGKTGNYTYTLTSTGVEASRSGKDYVLKIPSYKTGEICCEGSGCDALNKSYPSCASLSLPAADECAAEDVVVEEDPCETNPNSCSCTTYAAEHRCECDSNYASANACECNPSTETCCGEGQEWNAETGTCEATDECEDEYGIAKRVSNGTDTCDGDTSSKYTCDGSFQGTCDDVYSMQASAGILSRDMEDPFLNFVDGLLAANTGQCAGKIYCGQKGTMACCCSSGYYCDMSTAVGGVGCGTCKRGSGPATGDFGQMCPDGQTWNAQLKACVPSVGIEKPSIKTCVVGYHWDDAAGKCVKNEEEVDIRPTLALFKREVTCCGDSRHESPQRCVGESSRACGCDSTPGEVSGIDWQSSGAKSFGIPAKKGTQTRSCVNGQWSEWSACTGYTEEAGIQCHNSNWEWSCEYNGSSWAWRTNSRGSGCDFDMGEGSSGDSSSCQWQTVATYLCGTNVPASACNGYSQCSINDYCPGGPIAVEACI